MSKRIGVYVGAVLPLLVVASTLVVVSQLLDGTAKSIIASPLTWLETADAGLLAESLATATGVILAVLGIAITVVAIIVELAANRYNHRITTLFIREPVNIAILSFFVVTTIVCFWTSATLAEPVSGALVPRAGFILSVTLVTISLVLILPYFAFVFSFVSPLNMIRKVETNAQRAIAKSARSFQSAHIAQVSEAVDELHDVVRSAMEQSDRSIAMAGVDALANLLSTYQEMRPRLPARWFEIDRSIREDPDFISLEPFAIARIEEDSAWLEVKVCRQYLLLMMLGTIQMRDICYLIAINTRRIAIDSIDTNGPLLQLCIRCFNSYLRSTVNSGDQRTSYYLLNQYRLIAESIDDDSNAEIVEEIARHIQFYGLLAYNAGQSFLLEVAAYDVMRLLETNVPKGSPAIDPLLALLLEFDQELKEEAQEESLLGVRRAQIQAATMFLDRGDVTRARAIADDLAGEDFSRLERVRSQLVAEDRAEYWELTDRGITFGYLEPRRRAHLDTLFAWLR